MTPRSRLLGLLTILTDGAPASPRAGAVLFEYLGAYSLPQVLALLALLAPASAITLGRALAPLLWAKALELGAKAVVRARLHDLGQWAAEMRAQVNSTPYLYIHSWGQFLALATAFAPAYDPSYDDNYPLRGDPEPTSLARCLLPLVRPTHVASELEVFWTGRGGSFALSFLALSLSARVLLVFVLGGLA